MTLKGSIIEIKDINEESINEMYQLMANFYDNVDYNVFLKDLYNKDYCIILKENDTIRGFSTQKVINFTLNDKVIYGIFSGDTIIHKENWGSLELFQIFAKFFFDLGMQYDNFYWFLIVKGYKTYKILPAFFNSFYPTYRYDMPPEIKQIADRFGEVFYKDEYNKTNGIIEYKSIKDKLKKGVADITDDKLQDLDIKFFSQSNPDYINGNDMVCITELRLENLKEKAKPILFGKK